MHPKHHALVIAAFGALAVVQLQAQSHAFVSCMGGGLYSVNLQACTAEFIGNTGTIIGDIALTPNGTLYGIRGGNEIWRIDTTDASRTYVCSTEAEGSSLVALNDSILFLEDGTELRGLNILDSSSWVVGSIGYATPGDLTWYANDLYMPSWQQLVRITLSPDNSSIQDVIAFDEHADMPICFGATSAHFTTLQSSVMGFLQSNPPVLFCFSPVDGTFTELCEVGIPDQVLGAACFRATPSSTEGCSPLSVSDDTIERFGAFILDRSIVVHMPTTNVPSTWEIFDPIGRIIMQGLFETNTSEARISINDNAQGLLILRLRSGSLSWVLPLVQVN